jgi:SAM dependent carboxyl methyltransferase
MTNTQRRLSSHVLHGVTEARGSYNRHAASQAAGGALALPLLEKAARELSLDPGDAPVVIADYGASQGKNSLAPLRAAIAALRERRVGHRPICVVHVDVAENDFSTLFDLLDTASESYVSDDPDVFPSAVGRSFYRPVLPPNHVHLGWSAYAAVWLSRAPTLIPGHFWILSGDGAVRTAFERQAAKDWRGFLELRSRELRPGGRLVVALPSSRELGQSAVDEGMNHINAALAEMVVDRTVTADERARMILLAYPRRDSEVLAPFESFAGLVVEQCEVIPVPDPAWADYQRDHDTEALAAKHAGFFRATFMPSLASALSPNRGAEGRQRFIDGLADRLERRLAEEPAPLHLLVQVIVLAKVEA